MRNIAEIDLKGLIKNAEEIKSKLKKGVKFCAVVKADAYGHGAEECASALYPVVDCFAVAIVEEGVALRLAGIDKEILTLIPPFPEDIKSAVRYDLTLSADSEKTLVLISEEGARQGKTVNVHIKYNTGMNRLGIDDLFSLIRVFNVAETLPFVRISGLFSHFACPENERSLIKSLNKFLLAIRVAKSYNNSIVCHVSASGGFLRGVQLDMVRIGILLYGYKPFPSDKVSVRPVMRIRAKVIETRKLKLGDCVLYGERRVMRRCQANIVRIGYADGFARAKDKTLLNNRCMDISAAFKNAAVTRDGEVIFSDAEKQANLNGTISYEVLTKWGLRAEKLYLR